MSDQLTLLYGSSIDDRFQRFQRANPQVYEMLRDLALRAVRKGRTRLGMKMLFEVVRWEMFVETDDPEFKLNNNFASRYARLLMEREPELEGAFETRQLRS